MHHHHHQRIHHHSRSLSHHDSPPRHSPPHDPHYEYFRPYAASAPARRPCPHCAAPSTSFHMDPSAGDLICTRCGAVLDDHMRDETAEWRDYANNNHPGDAGGAGVGRARCGELVDEGRHVGGLASTRVSAGAYMPHGFGGTGSGAGAGTGEEKRRLAAVRGRLKRTHNVIENMVEQEQKGRYAEAVLERRARDARIGRGESTVGEEKDEEGGITVDGDYEGLMKIRNSLRQPDETATLMPTTAKSSPDDHERAFASLKDEKWSLPDAVLLHGSRDEVQRWGRPADGAEWTQCALDAERARRSKALDVAARSSLRKLHAAFAILEGAARGLGFEGPSSPTMREAVRWFLAFAARNDGLRVRGISSGASSLGPTGAGRGSALKLSLFGKAEVPGGASSLSKSKSKSASLATELHRLRQYAALGSAVLYLSAKRTGVGRTLTEVCSAFGTYEVANPNNAAVVEGAGEPLVRPKNCSRAMQELRAILPEVVVPQGGGGAVGRADAAPSQAASSEVPIEGEHARAPAEVTPTYSSASATASAPVKSEPAPDAVANAPEEAALADLVARMASSLDLPRRAASAAALVAVRCARDTRASAPPRPRALPKRPKRARGAHVRPCGGYGYAFPSDDVVAAAALLLACNAGGTMQRLARQAAENASSSSREGPREWGGVGERDEFASDPLDDLKCDVEPDPVGSAASTSADVPIAVGVAALAPSNDRASNERRALSSWSAWSAQPAWRRDVSLIERRTGVARRTLVGFYSRALHPRRSYFLGVLKEQEGRTEGGGSLMHNITAAAPLMSLRNL